MTDIAQDDYHLAIMKGLSDTFTCDESHKYYILQKGVMLVLKDCTRDGIMQYLHCMQLYWHMMSIKDPHWIISDYQFS
jgi:hypothetical protein